MITNSTYRLIKLVATASYKPVWKNWSPELKDAPGSPTPTTNQAASSANGAGQYSQRPVFNIWIAANTVTAGLFVRVWAIENLIDGFVDIPVAAFTVGSERAIYLDKYDIVNASGVVQAGEYANLVLIGYTAKNIPTDF
jgi:hypothetical protein